MTQHKSDFLNEWLRYLNQAGKMNIPKPLINGRWYTFCIGIAPMSSSLLGEEGNSLRSAILNWNYGLYPCTYTKLHDLHRYHDAATSLESKPMGESYERSRLAWFNPTLLQPCQSRRVKNLNPRCFEASGCAMIKT